MRTIPINLIDDERTQAFSAGQQGENNAVELAITLPTEVRGLAHRLVFDNTISPTLIEVGGEVRYSLPNTVTSFEDNHFTLESYQGGVRIYKSPKITLFFDEAIGVEEPPKDDPIRAEVAENTKARHTHTNKPTLDKFSEQDGTPLFDGRPIGGGEQGTTDHTKLFNREKPNQHPMSAIAGLDEALENKQPKGEYATKGELANKADKDYVDKQDKNTLEYMLGLYQGIDETKADKADIPTKVSQLENDSDFATKTDVSNASTLVVTITANPLDRQSYVADVGAREILNAVGQGRTVEAHFEDTVEKSGDQIYEYLKFKDNSAYFRRFYLMPDKVTVRQIDIEIKLNKEVVFTDSKAEFATADEAQNLTHDKLDVKYERIDGKEVSQLEARAILENPTEYEDKFIIFMANKVSPTKAVATGFIVNDGEGNTYLSVTDNEGHFKRFNRDTFETFEIIAKDRTKETLALDDLTIDVQGQAGFINSVHNAFNRPEGTSTDGIIKVVAYNIENQLQEYTDVKNGYKYVRLVTGTANQHSFGMWKRVDVTIGNAKVGEAVFVKAVDSNNHPTKYETKAVGGGGNLPTPTPEDNGKVPTVEGEKYVLKTLTNNIELPLTEDKTVFFDATPTINLFNIKSSDNFAHSQIKSNGQIGTNPGWSSNVSHKISVNNLPRDWWKTNSAVNVKIAEYALDDKFLRLTTWNTSMPAVVLQSTTAYVRLEYYGGSKLVFGRSVAPITSYVPYGFTYELKKKYIDSYLPKIPLITTPVTAQRATLNNGESMSTDDVPQIKFNYEIGFHARVKNFESVRISNEGAGIYSSSALVVDSTNLIIKKQDHTQETIPHNLTIDEYIEVSISAKYNSKADITVSSKSGTFKKTMLWNGSAGKIRALSTNSVLTDCYLSWYSSDLFKPIWAFGDSYFDFWPQLLTIQGITNWMIDGASGRAALGAWDSLKRAMKFNTPEKILWAIGMNDGENGTMNGGWYNRYLDVANYCDINDIELILMTIPSVPNRSHEIKNKFIREQSGRRYIDIAKAVGADISPEWYEGLLSEDKVHPTNKGNLVIANRVAIDVPELRK